MQKKYLVYGGYVRSKNDGQVHWVSALQVARLYGVNPAECVLMTGSMAGYSKEFLDSLRHLGPRNDGKYEL